MTRKEEIYKAARDYLFNFFIPSGVRIEEWNTCFVAGANWADEHPKNPWRDAKTDTPKQGENIFVSWINPYGERQYAKCKASVTPTKVILFAGYNCDYWMPIPELKGGEV